MARAAGLIEGALEVEVAGERMMLLGRRGVWWPARQALIVADAHLGKCGAYRASGAPIPIGVLDADLATLGAMIGETGARRLIVLGDLIHAGIGLSAEVVARVSAWQAGLRAQIELVPGNHDGDPRRLPASWQIDIRDPVACEGPLVLRHAPAPDDRGYVLCGHIHPAARIGPMRLPCFWLGERVGVLPAMGVFTGSVVMRPEPGDRVFVVADGGIVPAPR